ncbi:hypothetical protein [Acidihalobacter yilgarnensis]|uniref:hypothetical protein n=1 Tax=Acidihalobacter yilgarnensis TaxID=2819280 RepID=UPI0012EAA1EB|nr:hypothetical protein [Acidihalobacter yilgarnensis]
MQKLHYWGTAILMWVASVLLQLMALIGLVHVAIDLAIPRAIRSTFVRWSLTF